MQVSEAFRGLEISDYFRKSLALGATALLHIMLISALLTGHSSRNDPRTTAIATIFEGRAAHIGAPTDTALRLQEPYAPIIPEPKFEIASSGESGQAPDNGTLASAVLPPRPDPAAPNPSPNYPPSFQGSALAPIVVIAKILVLDNGNVGDAIVAGSSGIADLDAAALAFVKAHWRFLPGTMDGRPVKDWISVEVMFRSG